MGKVRICRFLVFQPLCVFSVEVKKSMQMEIGTRIRELRMKRRLSQEALADELHVSRQAVTKWENNLAKPSTANLFALCKVFGVSMDQLTASPSVEPGPKNRFWGWIWFVIGFMFAILSIVVWFAGHGEVPNPDSFIGYADMEIGMCVYGTSLYEGMLYGLTGLLFLVGIFYRLLIKCKFKRARK